MKVLETIDKLADIGKPAVTKQQEISATEAGNLWNNLASWYDYEESMMILGKFAKDSGLKKEINSMLKKIQHQVKTLENTMTEYAIALPPRPPSDVNITEHFTAITDEFIYRRIFGSIQSFLPVRMLAFQQSTSSKLREIFKGFLLEEMDIFERFLEFGKTKNWLAEQPGDLTVDSKAKNPTKMEAAQMWNKLNARYFTMEMTKILVNFVGDTELKAIMAIGLNTLERQAAELENMLRQYSLPLPPRTQDSIGAIKPIDAISDRFIYGRIFEGIQSFLPKHMMAFQQSTTTGIRQRFRKLLTEEINIYDNFYVYGQLKGWLLKPPSFQG